MEELLRTHKDIPFDLVLWVPMVSLWLQAALSAFSATRRKRDKAADPRESRFGPSCPPRLIAPR
jgi:hypothetical protein